MLRFLDEEIHRHMRKGLFGSFHQGPPENPSLSGLMDALGAVVRNDYGRSFYLILT